jgi:hypothetical protein
VGAASAGVKSPNSTTASSGSERLDMRASATTPIQVFSSSVVTLNELNRAMAARRG